MAFKCMCPFYSLTTLWPRIQPSINREVRWQSVQSTNGLATLHSGQQQHMHARCGWCALNTTATEQLRPVWACIHAITFTNPRRCGQAADISPFG